MADEIAEAASAHAAVVGSGRVGRTRTLSLGERAALAARAYIRHHLTGDHDALDDLATQDPGDDEYLFRQIKAEAHHDVDEFLAEHLPHNRTPIGRIWARNAPAPPGAFDFLSQETHR